MGHQHRPPQHGIPLVGVSLAIDDWIIQQFILDVTKEVSWGCGDEGIVALVFAGVVGRGSLAVLHAMRRDG